MIWERGEKRGKRHSKAKKIDEREKNKMENG